MSYKMSRMRGTNKLASDRALVEFWGRSFADGEQACLLDALALCLQEGYQLPAWVKDGFLSAFRTVDGGLERSWDAVFGPAKARSKDGKRWRLANQVLARVVEAQRKGAPIDSGLFEVIGEELGVSGSTARDCYYEKFRARVRSRSRRTSKKSR